MKHTEAAEPFQPPAETLPPIPSVPDIDWDAVRSIANEQGWQWDEAEGWFTDGDELVSADDVLRVIEDELGEIDSQVDALTSELEAGEISVSEWEEAIAEIVAGTVLLFFLFGFGGSRPLASENQSVAVEKIETQYSFLRDFAEIVLAGGLSIAAIGARARLYPADAELSFNRAQELLHGNEYRFVQNVLGSARPCSECVSESGRGIVPRETMSEPGSRICRMNCYCFLLYYRTRDGRDSVRQPKPFGWLGKDSLTMAVSPKLTTL